MPDALLTYEKFMEAMQILEAAFRVQPLSDKSIGIYYDKLKEATDADIMRAAEEIIARENFFPSIAILRDYCNLTVSYDAAGRALKPL